MMEETQTPITVHTPGIELRPWRSKT